MPERPAPRSGKRGLPFLTLPGFPRKREGVAPFQKDRRKLRKTEAEAVGRFAFAVFAAFATLAALALLLSAQPGFAAVPGPEQPEQTRRLVSICLPGDQLLLALAPREEIAAVSWLAADPDLSPRWRQARGLPSTRGSVEELLELKPDLVLIGTYSTPATNAMLRRLNVPVVEVGVPESFAALRAQIRMVASRLGAGAGERGEAMIREMDARLVRLRRNDAHTSAHPTALFYFQDGFSPGRGTFADALLRAAGFENLGAAITRGRSGSVSLEALLLARPQFLLLASYREEHPAFNALSSRRRLLGRLLGPGPGPLECRILRVPFRQLACPDPECLDLAERLQRLRFGGKDRKEDEP